MTQSEISAPQAPSQKPKKSRKKLYIGIAIVIVLIIILAGALSLSSQPKVIMASGNTISLGAGQYEYIEIHASSGGTLTGAFTVSGGSATGYLMTPSQYANFSASGSANAYLYTTGQVSSGSFNTNIGSGTYYIVIQSDNLLLSETILITSPIEIS